jgi:hypothetical protein
MVVMGIYGYTHRETLLVDFWVAAINIFFVDAVVIAKNNE